MKRKIRIFSYIAIVLVVSFLIYLIFSNYRIRFDNETSKTELITKVYNDKKFSYFIDNKIDLRTKEIKINQWGIVKPQCIRKTDYGGYAIYKLKSGRELYLFFNDEKKIISYTTVNKFVSSEDFMQISGESIDDILNLGSGVAITTSGTNIKVLMYFLNDDKVGSVRFDRIVFDGKEKIEEINIESDEEYLKEFGDLKWQPYILPMDRY